MQLKNMKPKLIKINISVSGIVTLEKLAPKVCVFEKSIAYLNMRV